MKKTSLKPYNSFGVNAYAADFTEIESEKGIVRFLEKNKNQSLLVLGGGTNILFKKDIDYPVLKINIKGIILADKVFYLTREKMKILLKRNLKKIYEEKIIKLINPKTKIYYKKDILKAINLDFNKTIKISKLFDLIRSTHINNHGIFFNDRKKKYKLISNLKVI